MNSRNSINTVNLSLRNRYAITEAKKADLDALTIEVLNAQGEVEQMQAIVTALTEKYSSFQAFLSTSDANMNQALANKKFCEEVISNAKDLQSESKVALIQIAIADKRMKEVCNQINIVMNKLIYSAEVVNVLSTTIIKEKALNPLISDDLITMVGKAGTDANNAVALCLVALESCYASQATNATAEATAALEYKESVKLYEMISGDLLPPLEAEGELVEVTEDPINEAIIVLLTNAYNDSVKIYEDALTATEATNEQLEYAQDNLSRAQIKLQSLQSGLAAANAAALAS